MQYMYEKRHHKIAPVKVYIHRILFNLMIALVIIAFSLSIGMFGYMYFENMELIDAFENAAMILSGMGSIGPIKSTHGKFFAANYALFCGIIFLVVNAIILAPIFHRFMHKFLVQDR